MSSYLKVMRSFSPGVKFYTLALGAIGFAYFGMASVLVNLYLLRLGFSMETIGQVNGAGMLAWAVFALPASALGRKLGLRKVVVAGNLVIALGYVLLLQTTLLSEAIKIPWLFASTILIWIGAAAITVNGAPLLSSASRRMNAGMPLPSATRCQQSWPSWEAWRQDCCPAGSADWAGRTLETAGAYGAVLWLVPVFFILAGFFYRRITPVEQEASQEGHVAASTVPMFIFLFIGVVVFFMTASEGGVRAFFNMYLDNDLAMTTSQIGVLFALAGILPVFGSLVMPLLAARFGPMIMLSITTLFMGVSLAFIGRFPLPLAAASGFIVFLFLSALGGITRIVLSQEIVAPRWRGATSAIVIIGLALGWGSMALVGSAIIEKVGFSGLMYLSAGSALVSTALVWAYLLARRVRQVPVPVASGEGD